MSVHEELGCSDGDCGVADPTRGRSRGIRRDTFSAVSVLHKLVHAVPSSLPAASTGWVTGPSHLMATPPSPGSRVISKGMVLNPGGTCWVHCEEVTPGGAHCEDAQVIKHVWHTHPAYCLRKCRIAVGWDAKGGVCTCRRLCHGCDGWVMAR
jgi:hypothetical protein